MKLGAAAPRRKPRRIGAPRLPPLFFVTDPHRTPDPVAVAARLRRGCGVIYRAFGDPNAVKIGRALAALARKRGLVLLVGADETLAARVGANGIHLPERALAKARGLRARRPRWVVTGAAHSARALAVAGRAGLDAALASPVFDSRSPSASKPIGPLRFARLVRGSKLYVYALGGVTARTAPRLRRTGAAGVAAVDGISE